ncbi:MAG: DUF1987 domain-containing protein [Bacteroidales bacterium]
MKRLYIEATTVTPEINFSPGDNIFIIQGNSSPEDVRALYCPVIEWLEIFISDVLDGEYRYSTENPLKFVFNLHYFNSSSAKFIFDIISGLKKLKTNNILVEINWLYDPEDIDQKEAGEEMAELAGIDFRFIEIKHEQ